MKKKIDSIIDFSEANFPIFLRYVTVIDHGVKGQVEHKRIKKNTNPRLTSQVTYLYKRISKL